MIWLLWLPVTLAAPGVFPLVDPGLFVISGVRTCGGGAGYCLLGVDCTLDEDFLPDDGDGQHCEGLRSAFTPSAHFVCCRAANYKPPPVQATTPLDVLENEVEHVLQKVAESVEAAQRTPAPGAELRDGESDGSTLLEEEALDSSIEGGVLQGEDDSGEEIQHDDEQEHPSMEDEELYQNDSPSETINILQKPKIEDTSEEKSTEENTISSESSESSEEESSSSEEIESDEVLLTTNKSEQKPSSQESTTMIQTQSSPPSQDHPSESESQNELKGSVDVEDEENNTEGVASSSKEVSQEESETLTASPEEHTTEQPMSKETLSEIGEADLDAFQRDENRKDPENNNSNLGTKETTYKNNTSIEEDMSNDQTTHVNTELPYSKPVKTKTKLKKPTIKDSSKASSEDSSLNEVVLTTTLNKKAEENSLHNAIYVTNKHAEDGYRTNQTNANSQTDTQGGFVTDSSVYPEKASGRPGSQGQAGVVCSRTSTTNNNCSREIEFVFKNRTLCFGSLYSLDWVVTSASCALRIFRSGMLNVSVSPVEGASKVRAAVKTIVVHESYAENAGLSGQHMEANNIGLVQLRMSMKEWTGCVSCLPQPGHNFTSNCSALTDRPMAPAPNCTTPESCKSSRAEESAVLTRCKGRARDMKDELGFHYLTLACDTLWEPRFSEPPQGTGSPLYCGGVLAGLEASAGMGLMVYTPVVRYLDWLRNNTRTTSPDQHFNLH